MKKIIWRNRVSTILGFLIILLAFDGFTDFVHNILLVGLGALVAGFGFTGNKYANNISEKYAIPDDDHNVYSRDEVVVPNNKMSDDPADDVPTVTN